jgi:hypothetical protein
MSDRDSEKRSEIKSEGMPIFISTFPVSAFMSEKSDQWLHTWAVPFLLKVSINNFL